MRHHFVHSDKSSKYDLYCYISSDFFPSSLNFPRLQTFVILVLQAPCSQTFWDRFPVWSVIEFHILGSIFKECVHKGTVSFDMENRCQVEIEYQYFNTEFQSHLTLVLFSFGIMYFEIDFGWDSVSVDIDIGYRTKVLWTWVQNCSFASRFLSAGMCACDTKYPSHTETGPVPKELKKLLKSLYFWQR